MRKIILLMHTSLDGFTATEDGGMDWINLSDELFSDVGKFTESADAALYGRKTYEMMEGYWPGAGKEPNASAHTKEHSAWYNRVTKYVVSRGRPTTGDKAEVIGKNLVEDVHRIKSQPGKNILMIGSPSSAQALLNEGLIDEMWLNVNPVVLGKGIAFYPQSNGRIPLVLTQSKIYDIGVAGLHYSLNK